MNTWSGLTLAQEEHADLFGAVAPHLGRSDEEPISSLVSVSVPVSTFPTEGCARVKNNEQRDKRSLSVPVSTFPTEGCARLKNNEQRDKR
ncbi:hypothetical protein NDU88_004074 [Pleurodeles waltl]|uniref:Uncharacterized protein n=1 Tax=Pleurodeles waltl TaxID=8319 RepID=A0AAV7M7A5_PLEWA|nr:hypothetical protein NDU88_004074 [Pleurodeles waltl]